MNRTFAAIAIASCATGGLLATNAVRADPVVIQTAVNPANGHTYHLLSQSNWTDAEAVAQTLGGHLATVNDSAENTFIFNTFTNNGAIDRHLWIGLNDIANEAGADKTSDNWVWTAGGTINTTGFIGWAPPEPNDPSIAGDEDYVHLWRPGDINRTRWNDYSNFDTLHNAPLHGVVEVSQAAVPLPAIAAAGGGLFAALGLTRRNRS